MITPPVFETGVKICQALGLDPIRVISISLHFAAGEIARTEVRQFMEDSETGKIAEVLRCYELHLIEDVPLEEEPVEVTNTG